SKYKSRILPSLLDYKRIKGVYPKRLTFTLAALISFYKVDKRDGERKFGKGSNGTYEIQDKEESIERLLKFWDKYDKNVNKDTKKKIRKETNRNYEIQDKKKSIERFLKF